MGRKIFLHLAGAVYVSVVIYLTGRWAIYAAYVERGYKAAGGEYFLIIAVFFLASKAVHNLIESVEEVRRSGRSDEYES